MSWLENLFKKKPESRLGIDLGSSAIKLVEILPEQGRLKLETYGLAYFSAEGLKSAQSDTKQFEEIYKSGEGEAAETIFKLGPAPGSIFETLSNKEISGILRDLCLQSKIKTSAAYFSLPIFTTFSTILELPPMPQNELAAAIPFEAKKYVPIPLDEVELDWMVVGAQENNRDSAANDEKQAGPTQVILVAILKEVIVKYTKIAEMAGLGVLALEPESFSLARSLIQDKNPGLSVIVDVGSSFVNIILTEEGMIKLVRNNKKQAEAETGGPDKNFLAQKIQESINIFNDKFKKNQPMDMAGVKCILTGGGAPAENLLSFLKEKLGCEVSIGSPFARLEYPKILESALREIGPAMSAAAGVAMRE